MANNIFKFSYDGLMEAQIRNNNKEVFKPNEDNFNKYQNFIEERYYTVAESLEQSLKEMKLMRQGKLPKKTFKEYREEWDKWAKEVEEELNNE